MTDIERVSTAILNAPYTKSDEYESITDIKAKAAMQEYISILIERAEKDVKDSLKDESLAGACKYTRSKNALSWLNQQVIKPS